ncbi:helix-turn-helix transcriptional regulator [Candidatus Babeliales bacterium]|nr:helix-turn-helix transcriptional regulator [Candidatus Babeliales bacterium]
MAEKKIKRKAGFYSISAVSKMFSVHQQTVRLYEKEGLICPKRSDGNTRMFSEEDVERLEEIIHLTHQLGINLAGVEMILQLQKKMNKMQHEMNKMFTATQKELMDQTHARKVLIQNYSTQLQEKKRTATSGYDKKKTATNNDNGSIQDWDIDYQGSD